MYTLLFYLAIVNKVLRHCHSWLPGHLGWHDSKSCQSIPPDPPYCLPTEQKLCQRTNSTCYNFLTLKVTLINCSRQQFQILLHRFKKKKKKKKIRNDISSESSAFLRKLEKKKQYLLSAAVVIGALKVNNKSVSETYVVKATIQPMSFLGSWKITKGLLQPPEMLNQSCYSYNDVYQQRC